MDSGKELVHSAQLCGFSWEARTWRREDTPKWVPSAVSEAGVGDTNRKSRSWDLQTFPIALIWFHSTSHALTSVITVPPTGRGIGGRGRGSSEDRDEWVGNAGPWAQKSLCPVPDPHLPAMWLCPDSLISLSIQLFPVKWLLRYRWALGRWRIAWHIAGLSKWPHTIAATWSTLQGCHRNMSLRVFVKKSGWTSAPWPKAC